jgi:predicted dehydrogenase
LTPAQIRAYAAREKSMNFPAKHLSSIVLGVTLAANAADELRIGMIGLDTSHATAFTALLNDPKSPDRVSGAKVVAAFKGGSPDVESSWSRVEGYTRELREKYSVTLYDSIEELCRHVDAVMLESVDGRPHLEQAKPVIKARKPLYIDKPMAGSLKDVLEIFRLAKEAGVPVFSSSSLRFGRNTQAVRNGSIGNVLRAETSSPCHLEKTHPDLFWYGIHGVESLFTVMGSGCESVKRGTTSDGRIEVKGTWKGERVGIYREDPKGYGGTAKGEKGESPVGAYDGYHPLVDEVIKFFRTGVAPVAPEETIELFAFMEAADESKRQGGAEVEIVGVLKRAGATR